MGLSIPLSGLCYATISSIAVQPVSSRPSFPPIIFFSSLFSPHISRTSTHNLFILRGEGYELSLYSHECSTRGQGIICIYKKINLSLN